MMRVKRFASFELTVTVTRVEVVLMQQLLSNSESLRSAMIKDQIMARGIQDKNVLESMQKIPRELFVSAECRAQAYQDKALPVGPGQTISQPFIVAYMSQMLMLSPGQRVLEIGTGTGYQTAILSRMGAQVFTIELDDQLLRAAQQRLNALGLADGVMFRSGDGTKLFNDLAPFDRIIVTAGSQELPEELVGQLMCGGLMLIPVGRGKTQMMLRIRLRDGVRVEQPLMACRFVPLV